MRLVLMSHYGTIPLRVIEWPDAPPVFYLPGRPEPITWGDVGNPLRDLTDKLQFDKWAHGHDDDGPFAIYREHNFYPKDRIPEELLEILRKANEQW